MRQGVAAAMLTNRITRPTGTPHNTRMLCSCGHDFPLTAAIRAVATKVWHNAREKDSFETLAQQTTGDVSRWGALTWN